MKVEVILLSGGVGARMGGLIPKQYLLIHEKPIASLSFKVFDDCPAIHAMVVVANEGYHELFKSENKPVSFALPGERRQDSLRNGMAKLSPDADLVLIHDAARPFLTQEMIDRLIATAEKSGAATLAVPMKCTIKQADPQGLVLKTLDRSSLYEIQTPQALKLSLLKQGMEYAEKQGIEVTDDVSLAELIKHPVELVKGSPFNIKITTAEDLVISKAIYSEAFNEKL